MEPAPQSVEDGFVPLVDPNTNDPTDAKLKLHQSAPPPRLKNGGGGVCCRNCRKLGLLIWKNLLVRKRHYVVTAFELILPILFAILLCTTLGMPKPPKPEPGQKVNYQADLSTPLEIHGVSPEDKPSFWGCGRKAVSAKVGPEQNKDDKDKPGFETEPEGLPVGVEIQNLRKMFGKHAAVDGVSLKMYEGEIFALLGHNGAGKTTTISCCIGMMSPSSGTAIINKFDIVTQMDKVREGIGICPQHNLLFEELTVDQHLKFFGKLKGGQTSAEAKQERKDLLQKLQLTSKKDTIPKKLSGGQKRKLCLGVALIGNAKVIFLDEPTSGMDVEARREIWNVFLEERQHRTIILTTHFMEEADVLGDRIGIMAHGKVQCCGTSSFLKKFYGAGYTLTVTVSDKNQATKGGILSTVQALVSSAKLAEETTNTPDDQIDINLPTEDCQTSTFSKLFKSLEDKKSSLGIKTFGLSLTTMDEVFVKVDEAYSNSTKDGKLELVPIPSKAPGMQETTIKENSLEQPSPEEKSGDKNDHQETTSPKSLQESTNTLQDQKTGRDVEKKSDKSEGHVQGVRLFLLQFCAFLIKRFYYSIREWRLTLAQAGVPLILVLVGFLLAISQLPDLPRKPDKGPGVKTGIHNYPKNIITFFRDMRSSDKMTEKQMIEIIGPSAKLLEDSGDFADLLKKKYKANPGAFHTKNLAAFEITSNSEIHVYYREFKEFSKTTARNMAANIKLRLITGNSDIHLELTERSSILPLNDHDVRQALGVTEIWSFLPFAFTLGSLMLLGFAILAAGFIVAPIAEKNCSSKQLQLMTGASPAIYWAASFLWDFTVMIFISVGIVLIFVICDREHVVTKNGGAGVLFLILIAFAYAALPLSYIFSLFFSRVSCGFITVACIHIFSAIFGIAFSVTQGLWATIGDIIGFLFPAFGFLNAICKYLKIGLSLSKCQFLPHNREKLFCAKEDQEWVKHVFKANIRQCCKNCRGSDCMGKLSYIEWSEKAIDEKGVAYEVTGIGQILFYLFLVGTIYHVILFLWEVWIGPKVQDKRTKNPTAGSGHVQNRDEDVEVEAQRVISLVKQGKLDEDALVLENFSRNFGTFAAVKDVNFGLHHGECFGLLGVNGAGKTTIFRMLTGDESRTTGNGYASECDLKSSKKGFLSKIGYCPQFDGIIGVLTGLEMVALFGRLRGVKEVEKESKKWMERVGLTDAENVQCRKYSGGMKRRLSAAMALVGDPEILLLDEPTTGVDPVSRREFWKIILTTKAEGRAIILTSHSMDEIAACCTRLAIMVNGELQCLGGVQYLKNRFAQGFTLDLKVNSAPGTEAGGEYVSLDTEIKDKFSPCVLNDSHGVDCNAIPHQDPTVPWDVLYSKMEEIKDKYPTLIADYSFSETTLEQVFLAFARMQYPPRTVPGGCCACAC